MNADLTAAIEQATGTTVVGSTAVGGGSTSTGRAVRLSDGQRLFAKHTPGALPGLFRSEAEGLAWLAEPGSSEFLRARSANAEVLAFTSASSASALALAVARSAAGAPLSALIRMWLARRCSGTTKRFSFSA